MESATLVSARVLRAYVQSTEQIWLLKELLLDGCYNLTISGPTVVWDIGMNVGLASLYLATKGDVLVVGFEPFTNTYNQALRNIALNPSLSAKIQAHNTGISDLKRTLAAEYSLQVAGQLGIFGPRADSRDDLHFEEQVMELADAGEVLDSIVENHPGRDIVAKIDCEGSEYDVIRRLHETGRLGLIDTYMIEWHRRIPAHNPCSLVNLLDNSGYRVIFQSPKDAVGGMIYAVRQT